jgi:phage terminase large subunit
MKINNKYQPLWTSKTRYYIVTGGRGSSKSFSVNVFLSQLLYEQHHKVLFTRYTLTSASKSIIPEFIEKLDIQNIANHYNVTNTELTNKLTDSSILFSGIKTSSGNQTANLKSLQGVSTWVLDEAEELVDEGVFDTIDLSIRESKVQNRVIIILNPATKEHWIYKRFFESMGVEGGFNGVKGDVTYIHTTYLDNKENLSPSFLDSLARMKERRPDKYEHSILGGWLNKADGVVFTRWRFGDFNPDKLQTSAGMDFGFSVDPDALTEVAIDKAKKIIYLKEHIYEKGLKTHILAAKIKDKVGNMLIVADSAEPRLIEDLKHQGINIQPVKKGTIESGVSRLQDYDLVVSPNSNNIAKELNNYIYSDKGSKLYVDDWNHAIDGIRYNVTYHLDNPNKGAYHLY